MSKRYMLSRRYWHHESEKWSALEILGIYKSRERAEIFQPSYQENDYVAYEDDVEYNIQEIDWEE